MSDLLEKNSRIDKNYQEGKGSYVPSEQQQAEKSAFDDIASHYDDSSADTSGEDAAIRRAHDVLDDDSIQKVKEAEESPSTATPFKNNVTGKKEAGGSKMDNFKGMMKKAGPAIGIGGGVAVGGGVLMTLAGPALLIVHTAETVKDKVDSLETANNIREMHVLRSQLKGTTTGVCQPVSVRCKFDTMSDKQVNKLKQAGIEIVGDDKSITGRAKPTALKFPDGEVVGPKELVSKVMNDPAKGAALNKAYSPRYNGLTDKTTKKIFRAFKVDETGESTKKAALSEDPDKELNKNVREGVEPSKTGKVTKVEKDGKTTYVDDTGKVVAEVDPGGQMIDPETKQPIKMTVDANNIARITNEISTAEVGKSVAKGLKGAATEVGGILNVAGEVDQACSILNRFRAVSVAIKGIRSLQLIRFAFIFLNFAGKVQAGDATPEEATYLGNLMTSPDTRDKITDITGQEVANPSKGKGGLDSEGFKYIAYGDTGKLSKDASLYKVGGNPVTDKIDNFLSGVYNLIPGGKKSAKATCGTVQSWWARLGGMVIGTVIAVATLGTSVLAKGLAHIAVGISVGFILDYLEKLAIDLGTGTVIPEGIHGAEAGNAFASGAMELMGKNQQSHGMKPMRRKEMKRWKVATQEVQQSQIAAATYEARSEPFNIMNQYSFMGSLARSMLPLVSTSNSSLSNIASIMRGSFTSLSPQTNAATAYDPDMYTQCQDDEYDDVFNDGNNDDNSLALSSFCNIQYGLGAADLSVGSSSYYGDPVALGGSDIAVNTTTAVDATKAAPDSVPEVAQLSADGEIDDQGNPTDGSELKLFVEHCNNRIDESGNNIPYGDTGEDGESNNKWKDGSNCAPDDDLSPEKRIPLSFFRTYMIDNGIADTLENPDAAITTTGDISSSTTSTTPTATDTTPGVQGGGGVGVQLDGVSDLIVSNQFPGTTGIIPNVTNIVIHWLVSNPESPTEAGAALKSDSGASVQFYVSQSGKIMQLTQYANTRAGHAKNANDFAIGIEIGSPSEQPGEGPPYDSIQKALQGNSVQKAQVIKLATALAKKFGIKNITVGNNVLYKSSDTCAAIGLSFSGTCATQSEAMAYGIVGHYQLQDSKSDPGKNYILEIQQGVKSGLGL